MFSIILVSWNNYSYLKTTIDSIRKNSSFDHQIVVHLNEQQESSYELLEHYNIKFTSSPTNLGLPYGANQASKLATKDYICLIDDDMYMLPNWDVNLLNFVTKNEIKDPFWISSTMIEPTKGPITTISPANYGSSPDSFNEDRLLKDYNSGKFKASNLVGIQATPLLLTRSSWESIGGYPEEFDKGIGSDDGLAMRLWNIGCRTFVCVEDSFIYHFQSKSTSRLNDSVDHRQNREDQFVKLFNITSSEFRNNYIKVRTQWKKNS